MMSGESVGPLIRNATPPQITAILGAMRAVAEAGRGATKADEDALTGAAHYMFGYNGPLGVEAVPSISPAGLAAALESASLREESLKFLAVMADMDGRIDEAKLDLVLHYAQSLGIHERYLRELADAAHQRLHEALADMTQANMASILNRPWQGGDVDAWLLPYQGSAAIPPWAGGLKISASWTRKPSAMRSGAILRRTAIPFRGSRKGSTPLSPSRMIPCMS